MRGGKKRRKVQGARRPPPTPPPEWDKKQIGTQFTLLRSCRAMAGRRSTVGKTDIGDQQSANEFGGERR